MCVARNQHLYQYTNFLLWSVGVSRLLCLLIFLFSLFYLLTSLFSSCSSCALCSCLAPDVQIYSDSSSSFWNLFFSSCTSTHRDAVQHWYRQHYFPLNHYHLDLEYFLRKLLLWERSATIKIWFDRYFAETGVNSTISSAHSLPYFAGHGRVCWTQNPPTPLLPPPFKSHPTTTGKTLNYWREYSGEPLKPYHRWSQSRIRNDSRDLTSFL